MKTSTIEQLNEFMAEVMGFKELDGTKSSFYDGKPVSAKENNIYHDGDSWQKSKLILRVKDWNPADNKPESTHQAMLCLEKWCKKNKGYLYELEYEDGKYYLGVSMDDGYRLPVFDIEADFLLELSNKICNAIYKKEKGL